MATTIGDAAGSELRMLDKLRLEVTGYWRTFVLKRCIEARLIEAIGASGAMTAVDAGQYLGLSTHHARLLLEYLVELGVLLADGKRWSCTPLGKALLDPVSPEYVGDWLVSQASDDAIESWRLALDTMSDPFGGIGDDAPRVNARDQIARHQARALMSYLIDRRWFRVARVLIDLGCGSGRYLRAALKVHSELTCIGVDQLDAAVEKGSSSVRFVQANFFDLPALPQADLVLISNICHTFDDGDCVELLKAARRLLRPGGRVLLHHDAREPETGDPVPVLASLHVSLCGSRGHVRSAPQVVALCAAAGLRVESATALNWSRLDVATV